MNEKQKKWLEKIPSREVLDDILRIKHKNGEIGMAQMVRIYQGWYELGRDKKRNLIEEVEELGI